MKLTSFLPALAMTALALKVACAPGHQKTLQRPPPHHDELNDYLIVVVQAAIDLRDALDVAVNTKTADVAKMGTEVPIINLSLAIADAGDALKSGKITIFDYKVIYNTLEDLSTRTGEVARRIIGLDARFEKAGMIELVTAVLGAFSVGFNQVYEQITIISRSDDRSKGKSKRSLPAVVSDVICKVNMAAHVLDPAATLDDAHFCELAGLDSHPSWLTSPVSILGADECSTMDVRQMVCGMKENDAWDVKDRTLGWCKCSKPAAYWEP
ncbi:hypothetical protein CBS101457_006141 [Exobasidium rhododendri]|nr:hypothetical protein CBS101457_006141 [Exobasidium rhododendri]